MKVLITGGNGQLAREVYGRLVDTQNMDVISMNKSQLDITNQNSVSQCIAWHRPDVTINCAAYTNVDNSELDSNTAFKVNAIGARNLGIATSSIAKSVLHISTDYVFNGDTGSPYREFDKTDPQSMYGKSKLAGEDFILRSNPKSYILRTAWLYGDGNNFVNTMLRLGNENKHLKIVDDQFGTPTSTSELANLISSIIKTEEYGLYHSTCKGECSWYDFASKIFSLSRMEVSLERVPYASLKRLAPRPNYTVLDNFMLDNIGMNIFKDWKSALERFIYSNKK